MDWRQERHFLTSTQEFLASSIVTTMPFSGSANNAISSIKSSADIGWPARGVLSQPSFTEGLFAQRIIQLCGEGLSE